MIPKVYFAGVNQHQWCEGFKGHRVLESFADVQPLMDRYRPTFEAMILDSGAFSEMTTGKAIDLAEYIAFCHEHGGFYEWVASLDSITGGVEANIANWEAMAAAGVASVPTFHQGEPLSHLVDLCAAAPRVGLGFQRPIKHPRRWLDECFSAIPSATLVHGWGMTSYTDYPFESVDSRTWMFEMRGLLGVKGQGADVIRCLTHSELLELIIKKYERDPKRAKWAGRRGAEVQTSLFVNTATGKTA